MWLTFPSACLFTYTKRQLRQEEDTGATGSRATCPVAPAQGGLGCGGGCCRGAHGGLGPGARSPSCSRRPRPAPRPCPLTEPHGDTRVPQVRPKQRGDDAAYTASKATAKLRIGATDRLLGRGPQLWQQSGLDGRLHLSGRSAQPAARAAGPRVPQRSSRGRRSPRTFLQVRCLNRDAGSVVPREVGGVHVEAPDDAVNAQPDEAPVVTWGQADTTPPSDRTCQAEQAP